VPTRKRLELIGLTRRYPGCTANDAIDLEVAEGEIHGVLGENGAGKSTLMRCIFGVEQPDEGAIVWQGRQVELPNPDAAKALGIAMVFQHFSLVAPMTVWDNMRLFLPPGRLAPDALAARMAALGALFDMPVDPAARVAEFGPGERQRVEIMRALLIEPKLLILDEPTAVLGPRESERLFETLRQLAAGGLSIILISHKLAEVRALCDRVTVLRRGRVAGRAEPRDTSVEALARLVVGGTVTAPQKRADVAGAAALALAGVGTVAGEGFPQALRSVSLTLRAGEILGVAGVAGSGQHALNAVITGELEAAEGRVVLHGEALSGWPPARRYAQGLQVVAAERLGAGAVGDFSLADNLLLTLTHRYRTRFGGIRRRRLRAETAALLARFDVRSGEPGLPARRLSGGNLQKFLLGRALLDEPRVLVVNHPTWGVDVQAAARLHDALLAARDAGTAVLLLTEDLDELYALADRIAVLYDGRLSPAVPATELDRETLGLWMTGAHPDWRDEASHGC